MQTMTKPALRTTDRLSQTVAALARLLDQTMTDIHALDSEMQEQVLEATQHVEERLKFAAKDAEHNTRLQVTGELEGRFEAEKITALEGLRKELTAQWEAEKAQLVADCEHANRLLEQTKNEHSQAIAESDEAAAIALERQIATAVDRVRADLMARFEADKAKLLAERNRAQQRLADAAAEYERQIEQVKQAQPVPAPAKPIEAPAANSNNQVVRDEVTRVEGLIRKISETIEDPETELSVVIRKNAERAELESYLRGLRFKI
jgi:hypothetical protein